MKAPNPRTAPLGVLLVAGLPPARRELPGGRSLIGQRQRFMLEGGAA